MTVKRIPRFPGYYADTFGNIWSKWKQKGLGKGNGKGTSSYIAGPLKMLKAIPNSKNDPKSYLTINLMRNGVMYHLCIHTLILETFVGSCPKRMEACHDDGDYRNNNLGNLRWDTHESNMHDKIRHGTQVKGEENNKSKLCDNAVKIIRKVYLTSNITLKELAFDFGVEVDAIRQAVKGVTWKHIVSSTRAVNKDFRKKLSIKEVRSIKRRHIAGGITNVRLASIYGVDKSQIGNIIKGKQWAYVKP